MFKITQNLTVLILLTGIPFGCKKENNEQNNVKSTSAPAANLRNEKLTGTFHIQDSNNVKDVLRRVFADWLTKDRENMRVWIPNKSQEIHTRYQIDNSEGHTLFNLAIQRVEERAQSVGLPMNQHSVEIIISQEIPGRGKIFFTPITRVTKTSTGNYIFDFIGSYIATIVVPQK